MKKLLAILLVLTMLVSMMPMAMAAGTECEDEECAHVAAIGDIHYDSIQEAVGEAQDEDTISVLNDHTIDCSKQTTNSGGYATLINVAGKTVTIDLNGKEITVSPAASQFGEAKSQMLMAVFAVDTDGSLTLKDSSVDESGKVVVSSNDAKVYSLAACYGAGGTLCVDNGDYSATAVSDSLIYSQYDEVVTINDGSFYLGNIGTGSNGSPWIFNAKGQNTANIIVNGGTFKADILHQYYPFEVMAPK